MTSWWAPLASREEPLPLDRVDQSRKLEVLGRSARVQSYALSLGQLYATARSGSGDVMPMLPEHGHTA